MLKDLCFTFYFFLCDTGPKKFATFPKSAVNVPNTIIMWFVKHTTRTVQSATATMESLAVKTQIHSRKSDPFIFELQHGFKEKFYALPYTVRLVDIRTLESSSCLLCSFQVQ